MYELIEANFSDLTRSPARLESSYEMRDLRIASLSLSEKTVSSVFIIYAIYEVVDRFIPSPCIVGERRFVDEGDV